jgi:hypothetical protein
MTLENLLRIGKLKARAADEREIARLLVQDPARTLSHRPPHPEGPTMAR